MIESYIFFPAIKILLILQGPNSLCYCGTFSNPKVRLDSYTLCICNYSITVFILTLNILCLFVILRDSKNQVSMSFSSVYFLF